MPAFLSSNFVSCSANSCCVCTDMQLVNVLGYFIQLVGRLGYLHLLEKVIFIFQILVILFVVYNAFFVA